MSGDSAAAAGVCSTHCRPRCTGRRVANLRVCTSQNSYTAAGRGEQRRSSPRVLQHCSCHSWVTAGALQQLTAGPRHCSKCCCRLSTWSGFGYDVFTLGFCSYEHISSAEWLKDLVKTKLNFGCLCLYPVFVILCNNCVLTICGELTIILWSTTPHP